MPRIVIAILILVSLASSARADGCYFPEAAYAMLPTVPTQRALIAWRNGVETLVVESSFDSPSPGVAWIVPLPAEPTKLEAADPDLLTSLAMSQQPTVTHDLWPEAKGLLILLILALAGSVCLMFPRARFMVISILIIALFFSSMIMSAGVGSGESCAGLVVTGEQKVGNYEVAVLRAKDAGAISEWLSGHGAKPLDARAGEVVNDYIAQGWCFVVARLNRDHGGAATPHPIAATFPAKEPIYPMKLTQLAGSTTNVQLFVVAEREAAAVGFRTRAADCYRLDDHSDDSCVPYYMGKETGLIIGSPDACAYLWPDCVVTSLKAALKPEEMKRDVNFSLTELRPHRDHVYSATGRWYVAAIILILGTIVGVIYLGYIYRSMRIDFRSKSSRTRRRPSGWELQFLGALSVATLVTAGITAAALPVVPVQSGVEFSFFVDKMRAQHAIIEVAILANEGKMPPLMTDSQWAEFGEKFITAAEFTKDNLLNPLTGRPMTFERTPGNYSRRVVGGKTYLCFYDLRGREYRVDLAALAEAGKEKKQ